MDLAKMTSKGQITVPKAVREKLNLDTGSKVVFIQKGDDLVVRNADEVASAEPTRLYRLSNDALPAFRKLQEAFAGLADEEDIHTEEELVEWMKTQIESGKE